MRILSFDVGILNLAYCIFNTKLLKIEYWEIIKLENLKDHGKLHVNLITELDKRNHLIDGIDTVLIEKQPSFNPKMRIIASCLQTYFFIRGVIDSENKIGIIKFFSPKHKLKCYNGTEIAVTGKTKYLQTKQMSIIICKEKLEEYSEPDEIKNMFELSKKKDDLADCYLQAITYGIFEKLVPTNNNTKSPVVIKKNKVTKKELGIAITNLLLRDPSGIITNSGILTLINEDSLLKEQLITKFNVVFPIDNQELKRIFSELKIKKSLFQNN
jgi:hypothetical protein